MFTSNFNFTFKNRIFQHQYQKLVKMFVFISWLVSFGVCIHIQYFFDVVRLELIERKSKVEEKNVMWTCFKFWPIKNFPKTISQWEFDYGLFTNLLRIIVACNFFSEFIQTQEVSYLSWQNTYLNLKTVISS